MAQCVKILPPGTSVVHSGTGYYLSNYVPLLGVDGDCSSGLQLLTKAEIDAMKTIKLDTSSDPQRVQDMTALFYAFLAVLVVVWGAKQLLNLFSGDTSKD